MEETVSRPTKIIETAIKASILGIVSIIAITILQVVLEETVGVIEYLMVLLLLFFSAGGGAAAIYRATFERDALATAASGAIAGGALGLLGGLTYTLVGSQLIESSTTEALNDLGGAQALVYVMCICPNLLIGAGSGGLFAWGMSYLPAVMLGIKDKPKPVAEDKATLTVEQQISELAHKTNQENVPGPIVEDSPLNETETVVVEDEQADESHPTMRLRSAIRLIETDNEAEAQKLLIALTREQQPPDPLVWLWLASTFNDEPETKRRCIQKVLETHPTSPIALEMLNKLEKPIQPPIPPPPVKRVPITWKPEPPKKQTEPIEVSYGAQVADRFWRLFKARMIWAVITIIVIFVCNGLISLFQ